MKSAGGAQRGAGQSLSLTAGDDSRMYPGDPQCSVLNMQHKK